MSATVTRFAKSDQFIKQLVEKVVIVQVVDMLDRLFKTALANTAFPLENLVSLIGPLRAFQISVVFSAVLRLLDWWLRNVHRTKKPPFLPTRGTPAMTGG